ncbi:MAG TPA: cytochrome C [candidate division Zixibacteria bacterium]|nr:cytochrome C [candidate division Zixibacteria bacterium]HEQ98555.1 cytochrome C [candidate division Zixibacteria bacterium]
MLKLRLPRLAYNFISSVGSAIAIVAGLMVVTMLVVSIFTEIENPYLGIFSFMILPAILIFGLILIPVGMLRQWRREKRGERVEKTRWPYVDLNLKSHRNAFFIFIFGTFFFVVFTAVGSYQAFHFSESVKFCGTTCHSVMEPEHTAYQNSPHARVACVECHVGPGAGWYTKSKLSGAYQVYATLLNKYPRPIPTPIESLRPARETCEQCHWPAKFFGGMQKKIDHYMYDEESSYWPINMLIKVGGGKRGANQASGIHWHISSDVKVEYIARDHQREDIPWVRYTNLETGEVTVYHDDDDPLSQEEIDSLEPRVMDCVDCHNRPSHIYNPPDRAIDDALNTRMIDPEIPEIKMVAVEAMAENYGSDEEAMEKIREHINGYYKENYSGFYEQEKGLIEQAIQSTSEKFSLNIFPRMKVRWDVYPDHIGHFYFKGCMRCHEGNHSSDEGQTISHSCNSCHIILAQGSGETYEVTYQEDGLEFKHPVDIYEAWREMGCYECHTGTQP